MNPLWQLGERVWYLPADPDPEKIQPVVGVVIGDDETVLIDAGNTPATARQIVGELRRMGAPAVGKVIYTHHHWDHVFGACVYGAPAIAHSLCKTLLEREAAKPWSPAFLRAEVARDPRFRRSAQALGSGIADWSAFRVVVPSTPFEDGLTLEGGGYALALEHVGGKHAQDSIAVKVLDASVMFLGDSFYPPPLRAASANATPDFAMLQRFLEADCETYLGGHGEPFSRAELWQWLADHAPKP